MNYENLKKLIFRYERAVKKVETEDKASELQKNVIRQFRDIWSSAEKSVSFCERFSEGILPCRIILDEKQYLPVDGAVILAKSEPEKVESIYRKLLFTDDKGDVCSRQTNIESFINEMEVLRMKYLPGKWKYKQDRHSTTAYMTFFDPENNYIYKYKDAVKFAKFIEFEHKISSGGAYDLEAFYDMCDKILLILQRETTELREYVTNFFGDLNMQACWHLVVSNMIHFCMVHNLYEKEYEPIGDVGSVQDKKCKKKAEKKKNEKKCSVSKFEMLHMRLDELEKEIKKYSEDSLVGKSVTQKKYGKGQVISQNENKIIVRFKETEKSFIIDRKYDMRPYFDNDEEVVSRFEKYDEIKQNILEIRTELGEVR